MTRFYCYKCAKEHNLNSKIGHEHYIYMTEHKSLNMDTLASFLRSRGWTEDRWGNFTKSEDKEVRRFKLSDRSFRYERKRTGGGWVRIPLNRSKSSDYYKDFYIDDNKIKVRRGEK